MLFQSYWGRERTWPKAHRLSLHEAEVPPMSSLKEVIMSSSLVQGGTYPQEVLHLSGSVQKILRLSGLLPRRWTDIHLADEEHAFRSGSASLYYPDLEVSFNTSSHWTSELGEADLKVVDRLLATFYVGYHTSKFGDYEHPSRQTAKLRLELRLSELNDIVLGKGAPVPIGGDWHDSPNRNNQSGKLRLTLTIEGTALTILAR